LEGEDEIGRSGEAEGGREKDAAAGAGTAGDGSEGRERDGEKEMGSVDNWKGSKEKRGGAPLQKGGAGACTD
jgi:hypothetical protein